MGRAPVGLARGGEEPGREVGLKGKGLGVTELKKGKDEAILAVGQGSSNPPRIVVMEHAPAGRKKEAFHRRFPAGTGQTEDTARQGDVRPGAARVKTILNQKARAAATSE